VNYHFTLRINWVPHLNQGAIEELLGNLRAREPARLVVNLPLAPLPIRLWERLVIASGMPRDTRWANLSNSALHRLIQQLTRTQLPVTGKSLNQDEFVTCGVCA
jgi:predicted flavoprotein YhiN